MPRRIIQELQQDVTRLLQIGSGAFASDEGLKSREVALLALIEKVPSLAPLAPQIAKVRSSEPRLAAAEMLQLSAMLQVVRASLSSPAEAKASLDALPQTAPLQSVVPFDDAFRNQSLIQNHHFIESELPNHNELLDSRVFSSWISAALHHDKGEEYWEFIQKNFPSIDFFIQRDFQMTGGKTDAMRLRFLSFLKGKELAPLIEEAYESGSEEVQDAAFMSKVALAPLAMEPDVFSAFKEPYQGRRLLAVYCMRYIPTQRSCDKLLSLLIVGDTSDYIEHSKRTQVSHMATKSLLHSAFPQVQERLSEFLLRQTEEISFRAFAGLFQQALSKEMSETLLAVWRRYQKVGLKFEIAVTLTKYATPQTLAVLFREMPTISHPPNVLLRELSPRLPDSKETFLDVLFILLDRFSVSDRDMLYRELIGLNAHVAVRERLLQRARSAELSQREKNILQTTFEEIRRLQRGKPPSQ